jgi:cyclopropane-fatty-acyl-phospholipid synthase
MSSQSHAPITRRRELSYSANRKASAVRPATCLPPTPEPYASFLRKADVQINGQRPWDIQLYDARLFSRITRDGSLGFAEAYMDGWWDCDQLDELFTRLLGARVHTQLTGLAKLKLVSRALAYKLVNYQSIKRAFHVGEHHYDIGNDLYRRMLDPRMIYSCGYWAKADNLADAQTAKLDLVCRKLGLQPGMKVLDIGCGWGGMAAYAAEHYGVRVTGITVSREQQKLASETVQGLPVEIKLADYRTLTGHYDRILSIGMFEHVGVKNYRTYFNKVTELLTDDGLFLLHTIGDEQPTSAPEPFIHEYIFPNGKIPSRKEINDTSFGVLRLEDWHNFGPDYDRTLMAWAANFEAAWPQLADHYEERFRRMWRFYLYSCAGFFRSRLGQLWQLVFSKPGNRAVYRSLR